MMRNLLENSYNDFVSVLKDHTNGLRNENSNNNSTTNMIIGNPQPIEFNVRTYK